MAAQILLLGRAMSNPPSPIRQIPPLAWLLIVGTAFFSFAWFMCVPFMAILLTRDFGESPFWAGVTLGIAPLVQTFASSACGYVADRLGRRRLTVLSIAGYGVTALLVGWVTGLGGSPTTRIALFGLQILSGLALACYYPSSQGFVADLCEPAARHLAFKLRYVLINVGLAIGPIVGAAIGIAGTRSGFVFNGIVCIVFSIVLGTAVYRHERGRSRAGVLVAPASVAPTPATLRQALSTLSRDRELRRVVLLMTILSFVYIQIDCTLSQHMVARFEDGVGVFSHVIATNGVCVVAFQAVLLMLERTERFARFLSPARSVKCGGVILGLGIAGLALGGSRAWAYEIATIVLTLGEVLSFPSAGIVVDQLAPEEIRATYYGAGNLRQLGYALGPAAGGAMLSSIGGAATFALFGALAVVAALLTRKLAREACSAEPVPARRAIRLPGRKSRQPAAAS
jgi:MFS family permease